MSTTRIILFFASIIFIRLHRCRCHFDEDDPVQAIEIDSGSDLRKISTPLRFGSQQFVISFPASVEGCHQMARSFCAEKATLIGLTNENIEKDCNIPIGAFLETVLQRDIDRSANVHPNGNRKIDVTVAIGGEQFTLSIKPTHESSAAVADNFCKENFDRLRLTKASFSTCVQPVKNAIDEAIEKDELTDREKSQMSRKLENEATSNDKKEELIAIPDKLRIPVVLGSLEHDINYSSFDAVKAVATKFCVKHSVAAGISFGKIKTDCIPTIETQMNKAIKEYRKQKLPSSSPETPGSATSPDTRRRASRDSRTGVREEVEGRRANLQSNSRVRESKSKIDKTEDSQQVQALKVTNLCIANDSYIFKCS